MGRPTKKTQFKKALLKAIETEPTWEDFKTALYKEYILHLTTGEPRWMFDSLLAQADSYYDYMISNVDSTLTPEELITDMGEYYDTPIITKTMEAIKDTTVMSL